MARLQGSEVDPLLTLIAPSGRIEADDDDSGEGLDALIDGWVLEESGQYTIRAESAESSSLGKYELLFEINVTSAVSYESGRFQSGNISGERITVELGSEVDVFVTLNATAVSEGQLSVRVVKDVAFDVDDVISSCSSFPRLEVGSQEVRACDFTASVLTGDTIRQYYINVSWNGDVIYAPVDPLVHEAVTTRSGATPIATVTPTPAPLPDLKVELLLPPTKIDCSGGPGTCTARLDMVVTNIGAATAEGPIKLMVQADSVQVTVIDLGIGDMAPGQTTGGFFVTTAPGGNC